MLIVHKYAASFFVWLLVILAAYIVLRLLYTRMAGVRRSAGREVLLAGFVLFMAGLIFVVFSTGAGYTDPPVGFAAAYERLQTGAGIVLSPFYTIGRYWEEGKLYGRMVNIAGNVVIFLPVGFMLPLLWERWQHFWKVLLAGLGITLCIEVGQLFVGRSADAGDLLLNLSGTVLGYCLYLLAARLVKPLRALAAPLKSRSRNR